MKITKRQLKRIIKEELETFLNEETSEDVMNQLKALGWDLELADNIGGMGHATPEEEKEYDRIMSNPEVPALLKKYANLKKSEYANRMQHENNIGTI